MITFFNSLLSFSFDPEDISNTQESVWLHFQTTWSSSKISCYVLFIQPSSRCLEMWSKMIFHVWYITYPFIPLGEEKYCKSKVSCPRTLYSDPGQGLNQYSLVCSPAHCNVSAHFKIISLQGFISSVFITYMVNFVYCLIHWREIIIMLVAVRIDSCLFWQLCNKLMVFWK